MIKSGLLVSLILTFTLLSCSWVPGSFEITPSQYIIRRGDTLFAVAWRYDLEMKTLASWNGLSSPYVIQTGQRLRLRPPPGYRKPVIPNQKRIPQQTVKPPVVAQTKPQKPPAKIKSPTPKPAIKKSPPKASASVEAFPRNKAVNWGWPTEGKIVAEFLANGVGKTGINIQGKMGQSVVAAASGKVVYSGNGLKGYGELIIIKHSEDLLSAYAYNRKRLVSEGSWAKKGHRIAEVGGRGKDLSVLHFEIRKKGKPVNPLKYLPPRS
jgi:lipoprotein NlpD